MIEISCPSPATSRVIVCRPEADSARHNPSQRMRPRHCYLKDGQPLASHQQATVLRRPMRTVTQFEQGIRPGLVVHPAADDQVETTRRPLLQFLGAGRRKR